jgi:hypothetical protein
VTYKRIMRLVDSSVRERAAQECWDAPEGSVVRFGEPTRSLDANAAMWPILQAFSEQLEWPVNGRMVKMSADDWKSLLSAAFQNEQARLAMGLNGGVVMLGMRTSRMTQRQFSDWLEFLHATAVERGVTVYADEVQA